MDRYIALRETIRRASGESLDLKPFEADMRHLLDTYITADEPRKISPFEDVGLLELIGQMGVIDATATLPDAIKGNKDAVAETIENNVRSRIIQEHLNNPAFYERMSALLDEIIAARRAKAIEYEEYLKRIGEVVSKVRAGHDNNVPEALRSSPGLRALYDNLGVDSSMADGAHQADAVASYPDTRLELAVSIDGTIKQVRHANWRGNTPRENVIKRALWEMLDNDEDEVERIFRIIEQQPEY